MEFLSLGFEAGGSLYVCLGRHDDSGQTFCTVSDPAGQGCSMAALLPECGVRDLATRALDQAGMEWTEVFLGGSSAVDAAVAAGLATSVFSRRLAPAGTVDIGERFGLPPLPSSEIVLHSTLTDPKSKAALRTIVCAFREHR